jgi:Golgi nucleoside diphosphatase
MVNIGSDHVCKSCVFFVFFVLLEIQLKNAQCFNSYLFRSKTPVYIKATAGMRLVTEEQARVIYDTIYAHLSSSPDICPFSVKRSDLKTITGTEEGVPS